MGRFVRVMAFLWTVGALGAARAETSVCVLTFDNHTADAAFDVLGKGLADMVITDLAQVPGVTVVERAKLEAVLGELRLQHSALVDPATAQRIGKLVGARYAVAGAVTAVDPALRLDVRLIEIESGKVTYADKILGHKDKLFALEAALTERLARALGARAASVASAGVDDLAALLAFARGLDLADRGDPEAARKALGEVVAQNPGFKLAEARYQALVKQLHDAKDRRQALITSAETELATSARAFIARVTPSGLARASADDQRRYFAYRIVLAKLPLVGITRLVGAANHAVPASLAAADRARFVLLAEEHLAQARALIDDMKAVRTPDGKLEPWETGRGALPDEDLARAKAVGLGEWPGVWAFAAVHSVARHLGGLIVLGRPTIFLDLRVHTTPSLAEVDPQYVPRALAFLDEAVADLRTRPPRQTADREMLRTLELYGDCLMRLGRPSEAIAKWQLILDTFPSAEEFAGVEAKIKRALRLP